MCVIILTRAQKKAVVTIYTSKYKPKTVGALAFWLYVSPRTIQRVLDEYKVDWRNSSTILINKNHTALKGIDLNLE